MEAWSNSSLSQVLAFGMVGTANTTLDFLAFNLLTRPPLSLGRLLANFCSTTLAMLFSFAANWLVVFRTPNVVWPLCLGRFLLVTLPALYLVQPLVLHLASRWLRQIRSRPGGTGCRWLGPPTVPADFIDRNMAKALATLASLTWNFIGYKFYVYTD